MSWQEELRRLDAELAAGKLSHDQHRKLRDELLAGASGGGSPSPVASPLRRPAGERQQQGWQSANPGHAAPRAEPPKPLHEALTNGRRTTAPSPADQRPTETIAYPNPFDQPTIVHAAVQPIPPIAAPRHAAPPPPPIEDGFRPAPLKNRRKPVWAFLAVGVLLVLALIVGGVWWFDSGKTEDTAAPPVPSPVPAVPTSSAPSNSVKEPTLEDKLPVLPGTPDKDNSIMSVAKGAELGHYSKEAAEFFGTKGVTEVVFRGSADGSNGYLILVIPAKNPADAAAILKYLRDNSLGSGLKEQKVGALSALTGKNANGQMSGTGYVSGDLAVTAWVSQALDGNPAALNQRLAKTVAEIQKTLPGK
ncbi:hypothetical protein SAMN05421504_1021166 [Amycolatopsis xylanica]|uniref:Flagellar basal body-associated protein FliL n=1 Tax=Amycolatopsis xylanica TaxID=589385 RepID=A0A1H3B3G1_9PSEU|nr:hypothetical protein [Amycolatopsis xylanica]SDX36477.1 hypothetical protein SAMN05421504_1021166 [Amycolatopsis xylanica]